MSRLRPRERNVLDQLSQGERCCKELVTAAPRLLAMSSIHGLLMDLEDFGLVDGLDIDRSGILCRVYRITIRGREALETWA